MIVSTPKTRLEREFDPQVGGGRAVTVLQDDSGQDTLQIALSDDGTRLAIARSYHVDVWALEGPAVRHIVNAAVEALPISLAFSRQGNMLGIGLADGTIDLWRLAPGSPARQPLRGHRNGFHVSALAFNARGTMLASGAEDGNVMLWYFGYSGRDQPIARELRGHARPSTTLAFAAAATLVSSSDGDAIVWNTAVTSTLPFLPYLSRNQFVSSSFFDPVRNITLSLPGIQMRDQDQYGCGLVEEVRAAAGRTLTPKEREAVVGDLEYTPYCSTPAAGPQH